MIDMCQNGGQYSKNSLTCDCSSGWEGPLCETAPTTEAITTTLLPLPTEAECLTDSACTPAMNRHRLEHGVTYCCPQHLPGALIMSCNQFGCGPCWCFE
ncbi:hypothetical protein V1264_013405 [Littorina saxatilis]|uniref:EGF-like domain-containing protein n=1 Tax=Littorina saxatilis TaxID=31220 RepID=A0AAN9GIJ0_9CAEN